MIRKIRFPLLAIVVLSVFGCERQGDTDQSLIIKRTDSPAGVDSREPEMNATADGRIVMSWVEKTGEKRYALAVFHSRRKRLVTKPARFPKAKTGSSTGLTFLRSSRCATARWPRTG